MNITIETSPSMILLRLAGDLRLWGREEQEQNLTRAIRTVGEQLSGCLVLSLAGVAHVDSAGVGSLVRVPLECARQNVELLVVLPKGLAGEAIRRLRIFDPWPNFTDEATALNSIATASRQAMSA
jgi:anti-anti-sigma factor